MPPALTTLFTAPADIYDRLGTEGVDLRLDDHNLASGQTITVTSSAPAGATSLACMPLLFPLLPGTLLEFDGGGTTQVVTAQLSSTALVGATTLLVNALPAAISAQATAQDSGVNVVTGQRLSIGAQKGTSKVKLYCNSRYDDPELVKSGTVWEWATVIAARWIAKRRAQPCPQGLQEDYEETIEELKAVNAGTLSIDDCGTRTPGWPVLSNLTHDIRYDVVKSRVEPQLTETVNTQYSQFIDWNSALLLEW